MLKIAICVKQVPLEQIDINEKTGNLERDSTSVCMNMYDYVAVETALRIKGEKPARVDVFTMGPLSSEKVLREAMAMGADEAVLVTDIKFSGADVLATSYTLACAIQKKDSYDFIICGKQTTDGDTGQIGGAIASHLKIPYIYGVNELIKITDKEIILKFLMDNKIIKVVTKYPILLSVDPSIYNVRIPSLTNMMKSKKKEITLYNFEMIEAQESKIGKQGSATKVIKVRNTISKKKITPKNVNVDEFLEIISMNF